MWNWRMNEGVVDDAENLRQLGCLPPWLFGLFVPGGLAAYGIICIVNRNAVWWGRTGAIDLFGLNAVLAGSVALSIAALLHGWLIWQQSGLALVRALGHLLIVGGLLAFIASVLWLVWRMFFF